jgi:pimeloyl-ACP methyl ester carboxylesterase
MILKRALYGIGLATIATVLAACGSDDPSRGTVVAVTETAAVPAAGVDAIVASMPGLDQLIGAPSSCDVAIEKVVYDTIGPKGGSTKASAGLMIPSGDNCPGPYPVLVYHHGTTVYQAFTMSDPANGEAGLQMAFFAAHGYVVVMPDYLGYGESTTYHPYLNAENTAAVSIDALRAARTTLTKKSVATNGKLFLAGYSQGGHAAMATQRTMERDYPSEFAITAAVDMSGPYALSASFLNGLDTPVLGASVFTAMTFVGYQKSYGDVYSKPEDFFQLPYANGIESLIPGTLSTTELYTQGKLPVAVTGEGGLLTAATVTAYKASADFPARKNVAKNDLLNWKPVAPVQLCGGDRDPTVPFTTNATAASAYFLTQGVVVPAVDVEQIPSFQPAIAAQVAADPNLLTYHGTIVPPLCMSYAKNAVFAAF